MTKHEKEYFARAKDELTEHIVYGSLAAREKHPANRALLEKLATQEKEHFAFWQTLLPAGAHVTPSRGAIFWTPLMRTLLGLTFTAKFFEGHEEKAIATYEKMLAGGMVPESHRAGLEKIINDERSHENALIGAIKEKRISYIGFVALGLADAIVEITGVHAGFLGVTGSTLIAGISGVIVGFAAAISMGSAAYLQAKQDPEKSAIASAFITGISYIISVILLALPYFLTANMAAAFTLSTLIGVALLGAFTFYGAIVFDRKFIREFSESTGLMLGTALATYFLGQGLGRIFGVSALSF